MDDIIEDDIILGPPVNVPSAGNTGDTTSNCDTAVGGVGAVMNHVAVANSQLCSTHTHTHTHTRIRAWVYNSSMHSVHQGGPAHRGACTEGTPVPRSSC